MTPMILRQAKGSDTVLLFQWANDPLVRQQAITNHTISWFDHLRWCRNRIANVNTHIWMAQLDGDVVGQVRFDLIRGVAFVDIHLDCQFRGRTLGFELLKRAIISQLRYSTSSSMCAVIKVANGASLKLFLRAGFVSQRLFLNDGVWCWELVKNTLPLRKHIS